MICSGHLTVMYITAFIFSCSDWIIHQFYLCKNITSNNLIYHNSVSVESLKAFREKTDDFRCFRCFSLHILLNMRDDDHLNQLPFCANDNKDKTKINLWLKLWFCNYLMKILWLSLSITVWHIKSFCTCKFTKWCCIF